MKSTLFKNSHWLGTDRHFIECYCTTSDHLMVIDIDRVERSIDFTFRSNWRLPFFKRVRKAFKYIFCKKWYDTSNTVMISKENIEDLEKAIEDIKKVM